MCLRNFVGPKIWSRWCAKQTRKDGVLKKQEQDRTPRMILHPQEYVARRMLGSFCLPQSLRRRLRVEAPPRAMRLCGPAAAVPGGNLRLQPYDFFFFALCCLGKIPGGAPFSQLHKSGNGSRVDRP